MWRRTFLLGLILWGLLLLVGAPGGMAATPRGEVLRATYPDAKSENY